jgi:hypothetical protein
MERTFYPTKLAPVIRGEGKACTSCTIREHRIAILSGGLYVPELSSIPISGSLIIEEDWNGQGEARVLAFSATESSKPNPGPDWAINFAMRSAELSQIIRSDVTNGVNDGLCYIVSMLAAFTVHKTGNFPIVASMDTMRSLDDLPARWRILHFADIAQSISQVAALLYLPLLHSSRLVLCKLFPVRPETALAV